MTVPVCFGCGGNAPDGLKIFGQYLCPGCEAQLIRSKAGKLDYQHWIDCCRKFWEELKINLDDSDTSVE